MRRAVVWLPLLLCAAVGATGCAGAPISSGATSVISTSRESTGNIYWNKRRVHLKYPSTSPGRAVLTYWAPNGYFTEGPSCKRGGKVSATPHRQWGNPSGYMHVRYSFKALTAGPDKCGFSAILNGTGSPPIAPITLDIDA